MEQLQIIIEQGKKINEKIISPTVDEIYQNKTDLLKLLPDKDTFIMNKKFFDWKQKVEKKEILPEENAEWLLEPLLIFSNDPEELAKNICNKLFEQQKKYVRARTDGYNNRIIIDIDFEVMAYVLLNNKSIQKHTENMSLYGANINVNGVLLLPIFLYEYITPKFNYENWKSNLELEPFLWKEYQQKWIKKSVNPPAFPKIDISNKLFTIIKTEDESSYLFTGHYTFFMMTNQPGEYQGDYHLFHRDPISFLKKIHEVIPDLKIKEESPMYYFQSKYYQLVHNGEHILTVYNLEYPLNFVRLGYFNHVNYHGLLLFLLIEAFKTTLKDYDEKIFQIGYLVKCKNEYKGGHNFNILQNNMIGPRTNPNLEFRKKRWEKEPSFYYRPDKAEEEKESPKDEKEST